MKQGAFLAQKWLKFWRFGLVIFPVFLLPGGSREGSPGGPAGNLQTTQKCLIFKVVLGVLNRLPPVLALRVSGALDA